MLSEKYSNLPSSAIAGELNACLAEKGCVVVTAPAGAGKSTLLPLTILEGLAEGKILMLEPRRIAARQIAERMSSMLGESCGKTVGYRVRFESRVSAQTRIEVLTEGILTRMLVDDPALEGVDTVIFDEFHERSLYSDEALALVMETRKLLRPDLRIVVMSATIDADSICDALDAAPVRSEGRMFPVEIIHAEEIQDYGTVAQTVARSISRAHREHEGSILAFLPGEAEIRKCLEILEGKLEDTDVFPLYGMLSFEQQRKAIAPGTRRKVVLATPIAETSLTIEGIRIVIDSGLCRKMQFDPQNGLGRMVTTRISLDMADQRSGRAGRLESGVCYRLWSPATERQMAPHRTPEILEADLAPLVLDAAAWGENHVENLSWLTPPPAYGLRQAKALLESLGALDGQGRISRHGKEISALPCHPRIAQMLVSASDKDRKALACDIAAILEDRDPVGMSLKDSDLTGRIQMLRRAREAGGGGKVWARIIQTARQYRAMIHVEEDNSLPDMFTVGAIVAQAYPERIAKAHKDGCGRFTLACADMAFVDRDDALAAYDYLAVASMNTKEDGAGRIFLAAPVDPEDLRNLMRERDVVAWDARSGGIVARHESSIGCLTVESRQISDIPREDIIKVLCDAATKEGESMFDFSDDAVANLQRRVMTVARWHPEMDLPDIGTQAVLDCAGQWLPVFCGNARTAAELKKIDMTQVLWSLLSMEQQQIVERLAPSHIQVPTGSRIRVDYRLGADDPVLKVRLQECFGLLDTPKVDNGNRPVLMELLSPGFKPVQLTKDLRSFWDGTYFEVRKELKRRYPKHSWPDNPREAPAVRGVKKKETM